MASKLNRDNLTLALCIALFPPIWAVLSPHMGITTGAVALICAGVYVANGNREKDALPMSLGFLAGDIWAVLALYVMEALPFHPEAELFVTLFVLGGLAVVISSLCPAWLYCPAWLCGWAIGLTIMAPRRLSGNRHVSPANRRGHAGGRLVCGRTRGTDSSEVSLREVTETLRDTVPARAGTAPGKAALYACRNHNGRMRDIRGEFDGLFPSRGRRLSGNYPRHKGADIGE